jgi:hypothetical protein
MKSFFEWFATARAAPWLILGKGPSFSKRHQFDLQPYNLLTLNHSIREQPALVAHVIDLDVVDACADALRNNAQFVVMPWVPHVANKPGASDLSQLAQQHPVLRGLAEANKLLWYNLGTASRVQPNSPVVPVRYFSAEAALGLLAAAGAKTVRSLGVDGGASYSGEFGDLKDRTLLANGRTSFDQQFQQFAKIILRTGVDFAPLDLESPIRVYVATQEEQMLAVHVLEYSIRKHASMSVEVVPMHQAGIEVPMPKEISNRPRTPFSFQRFLIPQLAGFRGRAVYLDSDMQVFRDMKDLWTLPMHDAPLLCAAEPSDTGRRPQFSVMLLDCARLEWRIDRIVADLDSGALNYHQLMHDMRVAPNYRMDIDPRWNSLERYRENDTALLHYTDMETQPWVHNRHPHGYIWFRDLFEAIDAGFISVDLVREHVTRGFIRPSVMYQVEHRLEDPVLLPAAARALDANYVAPFQSIHEHGSRPWTRVSRYMTALLRHQYQRTPLYRLQRKLQNRFAGLRLLN